MKQGHLSLHLTQSICCCAAAEFDCDSQKRILDDFRCPVVPLEVHEVPEQPITVGTRRNFDAFESVPMDLHDGVKSN